MATPASRACGPNSARNAFETKTQTTPSGGTHYLYRAPQEPVANSASLIAPGIDIRGMGGYILVSPSRNGAAGYVWEVSSREISLADWPKALSDRLRPKKLAFESAPAVIEGGRNQYLTSMAGALRRKGLSANEIAAAIGAANKDRCKPPLEEKEVGLIARSVGRYEPAEPLPMPKNLAETRANLGLLTYDDLCRMATEHVDWAIEGLLRGSGIMLLAGRAGAGKSMLARNLARSVGQGGSFLGRRCVQGPVLWVGLEEPVETLREHLELMGGAALNIMYRLDPFRGDQLEWLRAAVELERPRLVIIDTIASFAGIENICDYSQVERATAPILELRTKYGTSFCLNHHTNSANTVYGGPAWERVPDTILILTKNEDGTRFAKSVKNRGGVELEPTVVTLDQVTGLIELGRIEIHR